MKKKMLFVALICCASVAGGQKLADVSKQLRVFNSLYKTLDQYYVDTLNAEKNISTAIRAMLAALDPYTEYYDAKSTKELNTMTTGKYAGVGALIHYYKAEDRCVIQQLYEGKPAAMAGLKAGDLLLSIDGKDLGQKGERSTEDYVSSVSSALRGDPNTIVKVEVRRNGHKEPLTFDVTRASVQLPSVPYSGMADNEVGYIFLSSFTADCSQDVLKAFRRLKSEGAKSLILDLRGNGGGLANEAVKIVNLFVPKGKLILKMKGKYAEANTSYATQAMPEDLDIPLVVIVNENSASASEITCGSLQDLDRAVIVGERTYGKGLVQQPHELPADGILKLTTSHYYIPSGRCIQALDYSHRTSTGEAYRTPDSLRKEFYTEAGRLVLDGGGISPDVEVKSDTLPALIAYLTLSDEYFDYVTHYCEKHPSIANAKEFLFSDDDFSDFVDFIVASKFSPQYRSAKNVEQLHHLFKQDGMSPAVFEKLKELEQSMKPDLAVELPKYKQKLTEHLSADITDRYYYNAGAIENQIKFDKQIAEAIKILKDTKRYNSILKK